MVDMALQLTDLKPDVEVIDLIYQKRPGGVIIGKDACGIVVDMTFEDGHVGLSQFSIRSALTVLARKS